jgi:hypothetical protein
MTETILNIPVDRPCPTPLAASQTPDAQLGQLNRDADRELAVAAQNNLKRIVGLRRQLWFPREIGSNKAPSARRQDHKGRKV